MQKSRINDRSLFVCGCVDQRSLSNLATAFLAYAGVSLLVLHQETYGANIAVNFLYRATLTRRAIRRSECLSVSLSAPRAVGWREAAKAGEAALSLSSLNHISWPRFYY